MKIKLTGKKSSTNSRTDLMMKPKYTLSLQIEVNYGVGTKEQEKRSQKGKHSAISTKAEGKLYV